MKRKKGTGQIYFLTTECFFFFTDSNVKLVLILKVKVVL